MSRKMDPQVKSIVFELLTITGMMVTSMALLLPVLQQNERASAVKNSVQQARHQSVVTHQRPVKIRAARL